MPPSNLQGLNEIETTTSPKSYSDSRDLLNFPTYSDFNAQLDLWTNISFESDDHLLRKGGPSRPVEGKSPSEEDEDDDDEASAKENDILYPGDAHENVVTGIPLPTQNPTSVPGSGPRQIQHQIDLAALLTSFGVNPLGIQLQQQLQQQLQLQPPTTAGSTLPPNVPSLAQLLSLPLPTSPQAQTPITTSPVSDVQTQLNKQSPPAPKRSRATKSSTDTDAAPTNTPNEYSSTPPGPAEDKRRRNTAASARFRLKKKEREAALEKKAKELEVKVNELEKECEGLRRENGWLKGLVVGVTGGVTGPPQLSSLDIRTGTKRPREDDGALDG